MPPRRRAATSTTPGTPSFNNPNVVEKNGLLTPAESVSTPVRSRSTRALKKTDSGLTPASTVAGSVKDDTEDDLMGSVRKEVYVEMPSLSKRSTRAAAINRPSYVMDSDEEAAMEEKKPIIKDFGARKRKATTTDSELSDFDDLDSFKTKTPTTTSTTSSRAPIRQSSTSTAKRARTQSTSKSVPKSQRKSLSIDAEIVPDSEGFTASEEEEAYEEFAGDDEEVDFVPRVSLREKAAAKKAAAGATKGKGKAKAGVKGKATAAAKVEEIDDDDLDVEDEMLKAAIAESLRGFEQPKAGSSKQVTARSKEAEKRARAAERRMGIRDDHESEFSLGMDSEEDDEDFHMSGLDDEVDGDVKPSFVTRKGASKSSAITAYDHRAIMDLTTMRQKRAAENKRRRDEAAPLMKIKQEMIKKLKRKLTWAEINQIALSYHHPELKNVWGDLKAKLEPIKPTTMEAHPSLKLTLLPFQKESLYWMKQQEKGPWKGGMLADEMGMGKTIQTIALLLSEPRRKPSLVVAPVVALMQWKHEIEKNAEGFTVCLWHGTGRLKADDLKKFDVVMVSYGTLEASFRKQQKGFKRGDMIIKEKSPMHDLKWHRVILDEAHNIKERSTNAAKAAFALDASYRWCLSGTPLQNRVGELYSLVRFLGGDPFAFYYCKRCPCKSLHWQFGNKRNCDDCGHSPMQHTCYWNNEILTPIQKYGMSGPGSDAFKKLKILLDRCMLRRTKIERADDLGLPPRTITVKRGYFSPEERELYMSLFSETRRQFSTYIAEGTILNNYSNVFSLITRMRQMACHPDLVLRSKTSTYVQTEEEAVCRLCHDTAEDAIVSKCNHLFDRECISQYMLGHAEDAIPVCPVCHIELTIDLQAEAVESGEQKKLKKQGILGRLDLTNWRSSTKLEMLVDELCELRDKDCNIKSLVFSQFVSMLDLAAFRLQRAGFNICRLEGGMSPQARDATIQHFMKNPQVTVFLISLKAGGVALNLTEASQVFLLDSWWNPSVEYQSMDRIHRLGQHRPVQVTKLVVEDSIEAKILQLQDKKLAMTQAALATDPDSALGKLTEDDMQFLFRL